VLQSAVAHVYQWNATVTRMRFPRIVSGDTYMLISVAIFALNFTVMKAALHEFDSMAYAALRLLVGSAVLLVATKLISGWGSLPRKVWPRLAVAALLGVAANQVAVMFALVHTTAANVAVLVPGTIPLFAALVAAIMRVERLTARNYVGIALGLAGVGMVSSPSSANGGALIGDAAALGSALAWAAHTVILRPLMDRLHAVQLASFTVGLGTMMLAPLGLAAVGRQDFSAISVGGWAALSFSAIAALVVTQVLQFAAIRELGPSRAALYSYLTPFLGALFAYWLLSEVLEPSQLLGACLVVVGILVSRKSWPTRFRRPSPW